MKNLFKEEISAITPYEPGKPIEEVEHELGLAHVIKMASNENPLGPSRKALRALRRAIRKSHLYPDGSCYNLRRRLGEELGVSPDQLVVGNGSNEIIELLARGFLSPGDRVISSETSFLVYPLIARTCGAEFVGVPMKNFRYDLKAMLERVNERTKLIFVANPNNPTGTYVTSEEVEDFLAKVPRECIVCFDEAYYDFVDAKDFPYTLFHVKAHKPNVVVLRTFSKSYGLAGLRVGYGIMHSDVGAYLNKVRQPFNVNSLAQAATCAALDDRHFLWRTKRLVAHGRQYLYRKLDQIGLTYVRSQANFVLVDTCMDGETVFQALLKRGVIVRAMKAYGLDTFLRITVGRHLENRSFIRKLKAVLDSLRR